MKFTDMRDQEKLSRKNIIIDSALKLYSRQPFSDVRLTDIAKATGVVPATLYNYFPSYEMLMMEVAAKKMALVGKEFKKIVATMRPKTIEAFSIKYVQLLLKYEHTYQMLSYIMVRESLKKEISERLAPTNSLFFDLCSDVLSRNGSCGDIQLLSRSLIGALNGIVMTFRNNTFNEKENSMDDYIILAAKNIAFQFGQKSI